MNYSYPGEYPELTGICPNERYAKMLMEVYAGKCSELTAVTTYTYQTIYACKCPEIAKALQEIAMVEMKHLRILGEMIKRLCCDPKFRVCCGKESKYWCSNNTNYCKNICDFLKDNYQDEICTIKMYKKLMCEICDPCVRKVLQRIIMDEMVHAKIFAYFIEKYCTCSDPCKKQCNTCQKSCDPCKNQCDPCKKPCDPCKNQCDPCEKKCCDVCKKDPCACENKGKECNDMNLDNMCCNNNCNNNCNPCCDRCRCECRCECRCQRHDDCDRHRKHKKHRKHRRRHHDCCCGSCDDCCRRNRCC